MQATAGSAQLQLCCSVAERSESCAASPRQQARNSEQTPPPSVLYIVCTYDANVVHVYDAFLTALGVRNAYYAVAVVVVAAGRAGGGARRHHQLHSSLI